MFKQLNKREPRSEFYRSQMAKSKKYLRLNCNSDTPVIGSCAVYREVTLFSPTFKAELNVIIFTVKLNQSFAPVAEDVAT